MDFTELDSSRILVLRGGILMSIGGFLESLSQAVLVGRILVGRLGVYGSPEDDFLLINDDDDNDNNTNFD